MADPMREALADDIKQLRTFTLTGTGGYQARQAIDRLEAALSLPAAPADGVRYDDYVVPESDVLRLIKDHFSQSQQKNFIVSVGLNDEKSKAAIRNFADGILALRTLPADESEKS